MADDENLDEGSEIEQRIEQAEQELEEAEQQNAEEDLKKKIEEKLLKNKLRLILANLAGGRTKLNPSEEQTMKKSKQFPNLKKDRDLVNVFLTANKSKMAMNLMSASPILFWVAIGALILIVAICAIVLMGSLFSWLDSNLFGFNSMSGVTGTDFYGARMVYIDDEQASKKIVEDYVEFVENGIVQTESLTSVTKGGSEISVTLDVNIMLPDDSFDYSSFDESLFKTEYSVLYTTIFDMAKKVYEIDNGSNYAGTNLLECTNGILYFGYDRNIVANLSDIVSQSIADNTTISSPDVSKDDLKAEIEEKFAEVYSSEKYSNRTEKYFIKDYILEDDQTMQNISKQNYVAMIYMPKKNVKFNKFSYAISGPNLDGFDIYITNNGGRVELKDHDGNLGNEENKNYIYTSAGLLGLEQGVFEDIDTNNISALSEGVSLFDIIQNETIDYSKYLLVETNSNNDECFTFKQNGLVVHVSNSEAFGFVEFEIKWKAV